MRAFIKAVTRKLGIEIKRYHPLNSTQAKLVAALDLADINLVFDIGANEGQYARGLRKFGYTGRIVSFEPQSSAWKKLSTLASVDPNWEVHDQFAIGDQEGEIEIHIAGNSVSSSVLPMLDSHSSAAVGSAYVGSERVPIARLDSISGRYLTPGSTLFIKIDTQGFEWQVLDGARETLQQARGVLCELSLVPLYDSQRLWRDIVDRLEAEGFMLWALLKGFTDPRTGQSLQMDGVFLRQDVLKK